MPSKRMKLAANDARDVEIRWRGNFKDIRILLEGREVLKLADKLELQTGKSVTLPSGKRLSVEWAGKHSGKLAIDLDGVPLPGSSGDPATMVKVAAEILAFIAVFNIAAAVAAELGQVELLLRLGIGWTMMISGALYGLLAFGTYKRHFVALLLGVTLFCFDGVYSLIVSYEYTGEIPTGTMIFRVLLLIPMVRALGPIRTLRTFESDSPSARVVGV